MSFKTCIIVWYMQSNYGDITYVYLFHVGPRECAGEPLAKMELFNVFCNLLQRFTIQRENDEVRHSLQSIIGRVSNSPEPYKLRAICRS